MRIHMSRHIAQYEPYFQPNSTWVVTRMLESLAFLIARYEFMYICQHMKLHCAAFS